MTSEYKNFRCSCQGKLIRSSELSKHLKKQANHSITPILAAKNAAIEKPEKSESQINLNYSIKKQFTETYNDSMNIISNFIKTILNITNFIKFLDSLFPTENIDSYKIKNTFELDHTNMTLEKIQKLLEKFPIKEITSFKDYKQKFKSGFSNFMKKSCTSIYSIVFTNKHLITGGAEGILRFWDLNDLKIVKILTFHHGNIWALDIDTSLKYLISAGTDKLISLWNLHSFKLEKYFFGHSDEITCLKFLYSNKIIVSGSCDKTIRVWNAHKNEMSRLISTGMTIKSIVKMGNFNSKVACFSGNKIFTICLNNVEVISSYFQRFQYSCAVFVDDEDKIATGDESGMILIINAKNLKIIDSVKASLNAIQSIDFNSKNKILAACCSNSIKLWHISNLNQSKSLEYSIAGPSVIRFGFNRLYCCGFEGKLFFYDENFLKIGNLSKSKSFYITSICVSSKLQLICYGYTSIYLYCLESESDIATASINSIASFLTFADSIVLCGTAHGILIFLNITSLEFINQLNLTSLPYNFKR